MNKYDLERTLEKAILRKCNLVVNEADDSEIKKLELEINSITNQLNVIAEGNLEKIKREDDLEKERLQGLSNQIKCIDPALFESKFPGFYKKISILIRKELNLKFGNNSGNGMIEIKKQGDNQFTIDYDYFLYDIRRSNISFTLHDNLEDFLKSIEVKNANAEDYGSSGGHGSTNPVLYSGIRIIEDIFESFKKNIFELI